MAFGIMHNFIRFFVYLSLQNASKYLIEQEKEKKRKKQTDRHADIHWDQ